MLVLSSSVSPPPPARQMSPSCACDRALTRTLGEGVERLSGRRQEPVCWRWPGSRFLPLQSGCKVRGGGAPRVLPPGSLGFLLAHPGLLSSGRGACSQSAQDPRANSNWTLTTWSVPRSSCSLALSCPGFMVLGAPHAPSFALSLPQR